MHLSSFFCFVFNFILVGGCGGAESGCVLGELVPVDLDQILQGYFASTYMER